MSAPPRRRGGSAARTSPSNATAPQRSPSSSATRASAAAASSSASRIVIPRSPSGADDSRPASISSSRSRSCSSRYWLLIGRPSRAVARQLTWRMSSSGWYSRISSNSVPSPSGPRAVTPWSRKRPRATASASRRAMCMSGNTRRSAWLSPLWSQRASPSGPVARVATGGSTWRPRRRAVTLASSPPSPSRGSISTLCGAAWRMRTSPPAGAGASILSFAGTPR